MNVSAPPHKAPLRRRLGDIEFSDDVQNLILEFESIAIVCRVAGVVPGEAPDPNPDLRRDTTG